MSTGRPCPSSQLQNQLGFLSEPWSFQKMANSLEAWAKENSPKRALSTINEDPAEEDAAGWNKEAALGNDAERSRMAEALGALDPFRGLDSPNMDWKEAKRVLTDFDQRLEAMDAPPNTRPFSPASFKNSDEYQDAFDAQVKAICDYLPPISSKSVRNLPPPNHLAHLQGLMLWWAPRLVQVIQIGGAAKEEFWTKFNEVMDLWKGVPFFDDKCAQLPSDARRDVSVLVLLRLALTHMAVVPRQVPLHRGVRRPRQDAASGPECRLEDGL
jgi:hypothetical protein